MVCIKRGRWDIFWVWDHNYSGIFVFRDDTKQPNGAVGGIDLDPPSVVEEDVHFSKVGRYLLRGDIVIDVEEDEEEGGHLGSEAGW